MKQYKQLVSILFRLIFIKYLTRLLPVTSKTTSNVSCLRKCSYTNQAILRHYPLANQRFLRSVVYANMDEESNLSLISTELANELGASGPEERYFLTTCSGTKETK